jgi:hypothetical protein
MRTLLCVVSYTTLRFATRMIALLLAPGDRGLDHTAICFIKKHVVLNAETGLPTNLTITRRGLLMGGLTCSHNQYVCYLIS